MTHPLHVVARITARPDAVAELRALLLSLLAPPVQAALAQAPPWLAAVLDIRRYTMIG